MGEFGCGWTGDVWWGSAARVVEGRRDSNAIKMFAVH